MPGSIDEYTTGFPAATQQILNSVRSTIQTAVPDATEAISYGIPTFRLGGKNLVHYAAFEHHIGFYATPDGHTEFASEFAKYKQGKGSVQFPIDQPMPLDLIARVAQFRAEQIK